MAFPCGNRRDLRHLARQSDVIPVPKNDELYNEVIVITKKYQPPPLRKSWLRYFLRLSGISLQAIVGVKKQYHYLVDTGPTAANSNQIIIGSCWHSHMFNIESELSLNANETKFTKQLASCEDNTKWHSNNSLLQH